MDKITKSIILILIEVLLVIFFLGYSSTFEFTATVFFPVVFAVTLYFIVLNLFEINFSNKKYDYIFALLIGGLALFSTAIGYHYSSNNIDNLILKLGGVEKSEIQSTIEYMDEYFSHWLMLSGLAVVLISLLSWHFLHQSKVTNSKPERKVLDTFFISFAGTMSGALAGFLSIEANVVKIVMFLLIVLTPYILVKLKSMRFSERNYELLLYTTTALSSYMALVVAYYFVFKTKFIVTPFM